ncbi:3-deoxy-D-manno-octulosonic-acid transferase [Candidatus Blochmanniella floridana]|uniref:3-deoxy-D-manno-octulosonic acid transferase n=1 Tax=Blochmanniella floridana TaxID=203907 RepID=Q7VRK3_BLOFL|nr:3-deoxy-D-manno-octulosonic-acid transferase [Candidatus Blochmannia floridanus]
MFILYMFVYNIIIYSIQPIIWIRLLWRSRFVPTYRQNLGERYGFYCHKNIKLNSIIIHAVSVGETLSVIPLIYKLRKKYPDVIITLTSMTPAGLEMAYKLSAYYHHVQCMYLPYDLFFSVKRFLNYIQPKLVIIMETELWPNLINELYKRRIPVIIANARLSNISFKKYKIFNRFFYYIMQRINTVAVQSKEDAFRFFSLGFKKNRLNIVGNLKFDVSSNKINLKKILSFEKIKIEGRLVWIASSTHKGEEIILLTVYKRLLKSFSNLLLILVPRHSERFSDVINITKHAGFSYVVRSSGVIPTKDIQVFIVDTIGELMFLYEISDVAFIGGSLVRHGGHNPLEAAEYSIPLIMGPYIFNFRDICNKMYSLNGLIKITDTKSLIHIMHMLLKSKDRRLYYGGCAFNVFKKNRGASYKILNIISHYLVKNS